MADMGETTFRQEERIGLIVAVALHVVLVAVLLMQPSRSEVLDKPERMTVNLASEVGLEATAPDPATDARAAIAPVLSPDPDPAPAPLVEQPPEPLPSAAPVPPRPQPSAAPPRPQPTSAPKPRTLPSAAPKPRASSAPKPRSAPPKSGGGSRIGDDFLAGSGSSTTSNDTRVPASQIGASTKASIVQTIVRQIRPHWNAPQGADADQLVTVLSFRLNEDGSLAGRPRVISQSGVTDSNAPQKDLHAERAIRAVQLAAPFKDLPPEYYNAWKSIDGARFDRNLSR